MQQRGFHAKDGLHFARIESANYQNAAVTTLDVRLLGGVRIQWGDKVIDLTSSEWASVVASVSALGENATTFAMLEALQHGQYGR